LTGLWITVGVLAALLIALVAGVFLLLAMGRLHLDLGWGRSLHKLGPITTRIAAPPELVFEVISAPYLGRAPGGSGIEVLARGEGVVVAAHHTKVHFYTARTVEVVRFEPPTRVGFRHLTGPVPHAVEEFTLEEVEGATELRYGGEIGIDFFLLGRIAGRHWVRAQWERAVREHLDEVRERAEQRSAHGRWRNRAADP
jgi:Polyketide cyclase / dehydrase and lipid transport